MVRWLIGQSYVSSQRDLAEQMDYSPKAVSAAMTGKIPFSDKLSKNLCRIHPRLNLAWLLREEGEMLLPEASSSASPVMERVHSAPFYPNLAVTAGQVEQYGYDDEQRIMQLVGTHVDALFPVKGHSMEPTICDGDIVGVVNVDGLERIYPDNIYMVITRDNERMIKHIAPTRPDETAITLLSDNPRFAPFTVEKSDVVRIMKVVYSGRTY